MRKPLAMYVIVQTGGKQYWAEKDGELIVEKLEGEVGGKVELSEVLMVCDGAKVKLGSPYVKGAKVFVEIVRQGKGPKVRAYNYKAKKNEAKHWGHRQPQTHLKVIDITPGS